MLESAAAAGTSSVAPSAPTTAPGPVVDAETADVPNAEEAEQEVTVEQTASAADIAQIDETPVDNEFHGAEHVCPDSATNHVPAPEDDIVDEMTQLEFTDRVTRETEESLVEPCSQQPAFLQEQLMVSDLSLDVSRVFSVHTELYRQERIMSHLMHVAPRSLAILEHTYRASFVGNSFASFIKTYLEPCNFRMKRSEKCANSRLCSC